MHRGKSGTARQRRRGGAPGDGSRTTCPRSAVRAALLGLLLAIPVAAIGGDGPELRLRPPAQPAPQAQALEKRDDAAEARRSYEQERREDWRAWQLERGGAWRDWLRGRREAERARGEQSREDRLERRRPRREAKGGTLDTRLEQQWHRQRDLRDDRLGERGPSGLRSPGLGSRPGGPKRLVSPLRR